MKRIKTKYSIAKEIEYEFDVEPVSAENLIPGNYYVIKIKHNAPISNHGKYSPYKPMLLTEEWIARDDRLLEDSFIKHHEAQVGKLHSRRNIKRDDKYICKEI